MSHYLTHSLHSSWTWYHRIESKTKQDFLNFLNKVKEPPTEAMQAGLDFEANVLRMVTGGEVEGVEPQYLECVREVAGLVAGGIWQEKVMMDVRIGNADYLLYGVADVIKKDWIYDLKYTQTYEIGKYADSIQHPIYMACTGIHKFGYLISDGESVWREDYFFQPDTISKLKGELSEMMGGILADPDFKEAYLKNWKSQAKKEAA